VGTRIVEADDFVDENGPFGTSGVGDALLDDVRRELVLREGQHFPLNGGHNAELVFRFAMLENVLDDVVAVLVLNESFGVVVQFVQDGGRLLGSAVFQNTLDDTASVRVR